MVYCRKSSHKQQEGKHPGRMMSVPVVILVMMMHLVLWMTLTSDVFLPVAAFSPEPLATIASRSRSGYSFMNTREASLIQPHIHNINNCRGNHDYNRKHDQGLGGNRKMGCYTKLSVVPASISNTGAESFASTDSFSELILVNMQQSMENVWNGIRGNLQSQGVFDYVAALSSTDHSMLQSVQDILHSTPTPILALAVVGLPTFFLYLLSFPSKDFLVNQEPYPRGNYDPQLARQFYSRRPLLVLRRSLQLLRLSFGFILSLLLDKYVFRDETKNEAARARELLSLVQKIGPTAIKVGQALSVRSDLIPRAYAEALSELQDKVPPFSSVQAREVLRRELGEEKYGWLKDIDLDSPVASASIGQVYRGFADVPVEVERDGDGRRSRNEKRRVEVAVKVQRPNVLAEIALDLFIVREFAPYYQKITKSATDLQALANEWGRGFIAELTYEKEAENTKKFNREMKEKGLNAVTAPVVIDELSTNQILTTEWIRGKRLDQSDEDDVARLCGVALNAYLVMLLETGTLHCDPHPGNLLRTEDGKLCILDFGMTLDTPESLQYSLLELIAHLTAENFEEVPQDLVNLQFLKREKVDLMVKSGALEPLYYFLRQANMGGGGTKVRERIYEEYRQKYPGVDDEELRNYMRAEIKAQSEKMAERASAVTGISMKVEDLQRENSDAFTIPEWFLYTSRAFLTLEGISLSADPNFSIIKSCFPYVAKRLVGDDSPRSQKALRDLIYGKGNVINAEKISDLADGFTKYTTTTKIVSQGNRLTSKERDSSGSLVAAGGLGSDAALTLAKDSADILLAPEGNLIQNLLIEESANAVNANAKDLLREILIENPERIRSSLPLGIGSILPKGPVKEVEKFLTKSDREHQVQALFQKLSLPDPPSPNEFAKIIRSMGGNSSTASTVEGMSAEEIAILWKSVRENLPVYGPRVARLGGKLAYSILEKVSDNIEHVISSSEEDGAIPEQVVRTSARGISAAAKRSSDLLKSSIQ